MSHPLNLDLSQFPIRENQIYLNHAGTSPLTKRAADMAKIYADEVSNYASSIYSNWTKRCEHTRDLSARLVGAHRDEIGFVKSTTAGINLVAMGIDWKPGDVIVVEERTFPSNFLPWRAAEKLGATLWFWPEKNFGYDPADLEARLKQGGVRLVASTTAQFATGFRQDIVAVGKLCKQYGALHCVDAIQTLGVYPFDVEEAHVDFLAADSHKWLMGPEGAAIFYARRDKMDLIGEHLIGWLGRDNPNDYDSLDKPPAKTARRFEEGSPNIVGTMCMGESIDLLLSTGIDKIAKHNGSLCTQLKEGLAAQGWSIRTPLSPTESASIVCATNDAVDYDALTRALWKEHRIFAAVRRQALRLSPHLYQSAEEMDKVLAAIRGFRN